jgi:hypothetical protein
MAKSYQQRNAESIASTGKSLYQRRVEGGKAKGLSHSQARGHARATRGEQSASIVQRAKVHAAPKISRRFATLPSGTRVVNTRKTSQIYRSLSSQNARGKRVYFTVFNPTTGEYVNLYYGRKSRTSPHGMTVSEFMDRVESRRRGGMSIDEAIRETFVDDSSESGGIDSPEGEVVDYTFSNVTMYIR